MGQFDSEITLIKMDVPGPPGRLYCFLVSHATIYSNISLVQDSSFRDSRWLAVGIG